MIPVQVNGEAFVVLLQAMAAVEKRLLANPVGSLESLRAALPRAIDYLFLGM